MLYSIGHSTLSEEDFLRLLGPAAILVDVRSHPGSRAHPQFNKDAMGRWLPQGGKGYEWWPGLGGWDVRHGENGELRGQMFRWGVDLAPYSGGLFPKQRIAGYRLDWEFIRKQLADGCNCGIDSGIHQEMQEEGKTQEGDLTPSALIYLQQLYGRLLRDRLQVLREKQGEQLPLFGEKESAPPPPELAPLARAYQKILASSTKAARELRPCKWVVRVCKDCQKPTLAPQWWSQGLYDYGYFMTLPEFRESAHLLMERGRKEDLASCCCESLWYKCHRSLIADYCLFCGVETLHIQPNGKLRPHSEVIGDRLERYPARVLKTWDQWRKLG